MEIKYLGPSKSVNVAPYGPHRKNETKEYPDDFGKELLATSKKQKFAAVEKNNNSIIAETVLIEEMTVPRLKSLCDELSIKYGHGDRKADLIALVAKHTAKSSEE